MKRIVRQVVTTYIIIVFLLLRTNIALAWEIPQTPEAPLPPPAPNIEEVLNSLPTEQSSGTLENSSQDVNPNDSTTKENAPEPSGELDSLDGIQAINSGNGAESENNSEINSQENTTIQENKGENSASYNTGTDSFIQTGDANTTGTVITSLNTNADTVTVSEFNIENNQTGDLVLDFDQYCISGCESDILAVNSGNGTGSENNALINNLSEDATFQKNEIEIGSALILDSNSGNNEASYNTGGDSTIITGDANTSGNVLTFANNNIAGKIIFGVVNIFGNLVGDIILPDMQSICTGFSCPNISVENADNGAESTNSATTTAKDSETAFQNNEAKIINNLELEATSGDNKTSYNTGGDFTVTTGDANTQAQVLNIVNNNIEGDNMWLVIVNKAGEWVGQILGAPEGSNFAGSSGTEFSVNPTGEITASNSGNGANSQNNAQVSQENENLTVQDNVAKIINNLFLSSNTGNNETSYNTGGDSTIKTGDAKVVANLVNFVNNNISGNGKLVVTVVNVFGSWLGNFVTPGNKREPDNNSENQNSSTIAENPAQTTSPQAVSQSTNQDGNSVNTQTATKNSDKSEDQPAVAGQAETTIQGLTVAQNSQDKPPAKVLRFNLAWLLLALPFIPLFHLVKKK